MGLEEEILAAKNDNCCILIQSDANAKVGRVIIPGNTHKCIDENGQQLIALIERHDLEILNGHKNCVGTVTRYRKTIVGEEASVLDYVIVCQDLFLHFDSMLIDEERKFTLTNYATTKGKKKIIQSDHNPLLATFNLKYEKKRNKCQRREIFNLKNKECQESFFLDTNLGHKFQTIFSNNASFEDKCNNFFKAFNGALHKNFKKIRIDSNSIARRVHSGQIEKLISARQNLSKQRSSFKCKLAKQIMENKINEIDQNISQLTSERNLKIVREAVKIMENKEGGFSQGGMWKLRNSLVSKCIETPMAKRDWQGNLITDRNMLRQLYLNTYKERLKNQDIKPELRDLYEMKMELWKLRLAESQNKKTNEWEINDLNHVLKSLKRNKSRDPHGLLNDLFKDCLGNDVKMALLALLNEIKKEQKLPKLLQFANITTIWKKKGSRQDLNNDRGIFVVSIIRMILDSLIYRDLFPLIERNMSDSNIGARKERNIRDHLFIVYGIMNSVMHGDEEPVDIQIYDVEKVLINCG